MAYHKPKFPPLHEIPIQFAKGVGPQRARLMEKLGIQTIEDALWFIPWRYDDRSEVLPIRNLLPGMKATIQGVVERCRTRTTSRRRMSLVTVTVGDETGSLDCVFFNQPYLQKIFIPGIKILLTGSVAPHSSSPRYTMRSPQYEMIQEEEEQDPPGRIIPIYHETHGLSSKQIRHIMRSIFEHYGRQVPEILPDSLRGSLGLPSLFDALHRLHFPETTQSMELLNGYDTVDHRRLAFEELFLLQLALALRRQQLQRKVKGISFSVDNRLVAKLGEGLPYALTSAQQRVVEEIARDMKREQCMNRLIQGDVGCGKTVVALHALLMACGSGYQAAFMAPTEVLSEQHYLSLAPTLKMLNVECTVLKGGQGGTARKERLAKIREGKVQIIIGTHALLQPDVEFSKLGLVIVDEQHKFGVMQRAQLRKKSFGQPDVLVMTATPIPRTLAMTFYGDLDVSCIDEFPPGKKPIETRLFREASRIEAYEVLRKQLEMGRQAYVVYPLVEPSEKLDLNAAIEGVERLQADLSPFKVGLLHGRLPSREKQHVMKKFQQREIHVLVATTVVEVGLDVQNATVMVVEHAERFGLAQLHQLRGRVGRGEHQGYCLLIHSLNISNPTTKIENSGLPFTSGILRSDPSLSPQSEHYSTSARQRLKVFAQCQDGFRLAEEDLNLRGPGQVLGTRQWGGLEFWVADVSRDVGLLIKAKEIAKEIFEMDPYLNFLEHQELKNSLFRKWGEKLALGHIG